MADDMDAAQEKPLDRDTLRRELTEAFAVLDGSDLGYVRLLSGLSEDDLRRARAL